MTTCPVWKFVLYYNFLQKLHVEKKIKYILK